MAKTNSVGSNNLSLKYQRFASAGGKDIEMRKFEFLGQNSIPLNSESFPCTF